MPLWSTEEYMEKLHVDKCILTFPNLWASSADEKLVIFFLFIPENKIWHFKQIIPIGDNLYETSNLVFLEK